MAHQLGFRRCADVGVPVGSSSASHGHLAGRVIRQQAGGAVVPTLDLAGGGADEFYAAMDAGRPTDTIQSELAAKHLGRHVNSSPVMF
jgi:hypothetical protein